MHTATLRKGNHQTRLLWCSFTPAAAISLADGRVYFKVQELAVELYTDLKDPALEERLEAVFDSHSLFYEKTETWIASEKLYEVRYGMEV